MSHDTTEAQQLPDVATLTHMMWETQLANGKKVKAEVDADCEHAREVQEAMLFDLLAKNANTPYGLEHGFASIKTVDDFKRACPPSTYDDYAGYIYEVMEHGTDGVVTAGHIDHFSETSGTMGNPKGIPYTAEMETALYGYGNDYSIALVDRDLGPVLAEGRKFSMMECHLKTLKGGATFGALSSKGVMGYKQILPALTTSPEEAVFSKNGTDTRYLHARFLLQARDCRLFTAVFMSSLLDMMRYIEDNWPMLVHDIETGTVDESVQLLDEDRATLLPKLSPMPDRAAELRAAFEEGFDTPIMQRIWPDAKLLWTVAGAGFAPYTERMRRYSGDLPINYAGYSASEGLFSVPVAIDDARSVLLPRNAYYEFLPLGETDYSKTIGVEDLEEGQSYEIIVTTRGGFYRYLMRDAIKCVGHKGTMPLMEFLFRIDQTVNIAGEKTTELVLRNAADRVANRMGLDLVDFSCYPSVDVQPPRYEMLYEFHGTNPEAIDRDELSRITDEEIRAGNYDMAYMTEDGTFQPAVAHVLQPETNLLWRDMRVMKGAAPNQIKPVHVLDNEQKRRFFFALIER